MPLPALGEWHELLTVVVWIAPLALGGALLALALDRGHIPGVRFVAADPAEAPGWDGSDVVMAFLVYVLSTTAIVQILPMAGLDDPGELVRGFLRQLLWGGIYVGFIWIVVARLRGQGWEALGLRATPIRNLLPLLALFLFTHLPIQWLHALSRLLLTTLGVEGEEQTSVTLVREAGADGHFAAVALLVVGTVALVPFCEEVLFRGFLFGWLRRRGRPVAYIGSAAVFALFHVTPAVLLPLFLVGIILAYVYDRTRSLWPAILFHAAFNGTQVATILSGHG